MASLADTIKKNKTTLTRGPGGVLTEQSPEEIQKLSQKAGLQAPPTTPLGQSLLGANKDQQKMAGTPQQKQAALTLSSEPTSLADTLRRQQVRTTTTADEQAKMQKAQSLQGLGSVGDKVQQFIQTQKQQLAGNDQAVNVAANQQFQGTDLTPVANDLAALRQNPNDIVSLAKVNEYLGRDPNSLLSLDEINQLYNTSTQAISQGGAERLQDNLRVTDLVQQGNLGYDTNQLSELLGVPADQIANMTVPDLSKLIDETMQREFTASQQTQAQAVSPLAGGAERAAAQQLSREQAATGITATEADFARLEDRISNADTVTFGGQEMTIEEALSDENISKAIIDYMNAAPDSEARKQFEQSEPDLVKFIQDNQAVFDATTKQLGESATELKSINEANKGLTSFGGTQLDEGLAAALIPGYGKISTQRIDRTQVPVLRMLDSLPPNAQPIVATELNNLEKTLGRPYVEQLVNMSPQEIMKLGIDNNSPQWKMFKQNAAIAEDLKAKQRSLPKDQFRNYLATTLVGSPEKANDLVNTGAVLTALGEPFPPDMDLAYNMVSSIGVDPNYTMQNVINSSNATNMKSAANNGTWDINRITSGANQKPTSKFYSAIGDGMKSGVITMEQSQQAVNAANGNLDTMRDLNRKVKQFPVMRDSGWLDIQVRELAKRDALANPHIKSRMDVTDQAMSWYGGGDSVMEGDLADFLKSRQLAKEALDLLNSWYPESLQSPDIAAYKSKLEDLQRPRQVRRPTKSSGRANNRGEVIKTV